MGGTAWELWYKAQQLSPEQREALIHIVDELLKYTESHRIKVDLAPHWLQEFEDDVEVHHD